MLTDDKIADIRENITQWFLVDVGQIYHREGVSDGTGSVDNHWVLFPGGGNVPMRIEQMTFRAGQVEQFAGAEYLSIIYKIYLPFDTNIEPDCRIFIKNKWFETRVFETSMTSNFYKLVHVSEILNVRA